MNLPWSELSIAQQKQGIKINKKECSLISSPIPTTKLSPEKIYESRELGALIHVAVCVVGIGIRGIEIYQSVRAEPVIEDVSLSPAHYPCAIDVHDAHKHCERIFQQKICARSRARSSDERER